MTACSSSSNTCAVVIPVYNEENCIVDTLARVRKVIAEVPDWEFQIICVNDGSTDRSGELLKTESGITLIEHAVNRGYGAALRTGLDSAEQEWIFIIDADGTYNLDDLRHLLDEASRGQDMVVGAREGIGIVRSPFRRLARWILRKMVHGLTGRMVPDLNSGIRVFRRSVYLEFRHLLPMGFSFTTTITVASLYAGYRVAYIPTHYSRRVGRSNIRPVRDFMGFVILIIRLASYFDPLRFFLPLSFSIFALALARAIRDVVVANTIGSLGVIMFLMALQVFVLGVIADVVVKRSSIRLPRA